LFDFIRTFDSLCFLPLAQQPNLGLGRLIVVEVSRLHTIRRTYIHKYTPDRTPLNEWSARRRGRYLHNTQQTWETNIHASSGTRTRDPSNKATVDSLLRSQDTGIGQFTSK